MPKIQVIPLGSCSLTIPLVRLQRREFIASLLPEVGFTRWPLSFSPGAALQLVNVARGSLRVPPIVRDICYSGVPASVADDAAERLARAEVVLIEMSTPLELHFRHFILNHNRLRTFVSAKFAAMDEAAKEVARKWVGSLHRGNAAITTRRRGALLDIVNAQIRDRHLRLIIAGTSASQSGEDDIVCYMQSIREILGLPIGIVIFNFRYLPDGAPVEWPAGFNANVRAAAHRLGIAVYDPGPLVQKHGVDAAIAGDGGHYTYAFNEIVADEYAEFITSVAGSR